MKPNILFSLIVAMSVSAPLWAQPLPLSEIDQRMINQVVIEGNEQIPDEEILSRVSLQVVPGSRATAADVREDLEHLYLLGYFSKVDAELREEQSGVVLTYRVTENPKVKRVDFQGNTVASDEELLDIVSVRPGSILSYEELNQDIIRLGDYYGKQGYSLYKLKDVTFSPTGSTVVFDIDEGVVNEIRFDGNEKVKDKLLLREMKTKKGDVFNTENLRQDREQLLRLGYFSAVSAPRLVPAEDENKINVVFTVEERDINSVSLGLEQGIKAINAVGNLKLNNLLGTGESFTTRVQYGSEKMYSAHYFVPWIGQHHVSLGLNRWVQINKERGSETDTLYSVQRNGGDVRLGFPISSTMQGYITYASQLISARSDGAAGDIPPYWKNSISFSFSYDSRNDPNEPTSGASLFTEITRGGDFQYFKLGGIIFSRFSLDYSKFFSLAERNTLGIRVSYGIYEPITGAADKLELDEFSVGGTYSVRGYYDSNPQQNLIKLLSNIEYRWKLTDIFTLVGFYDIGSAYEKRLDMDKVLIGKGVGVRIATPLGPIRLDGAWNKHSDFVFHFGLGHMF